MWFFFVLVALGAALGCAYEQLRKEIRRFAPKGLLFLSVFAAAMITAAVLVGSTLLAFYADGGVLFRHEKALAMFSVVTAFAVITAEMMRVLECARAYRGQPPRRIRA